MADQKMKKKLEDARILNEVNEMNNFLGEPEY